MKKILFFSCLEILVIFFSLELYGQDDGTKLDILKAPSSPASNLLGFATTDIEKPADLSSLMLSLQSSSSSFSKLPSHYAIDFAPYWLFRTKTDFSTNGLNSEKFKDYFRQTLVISFAIRSSDSTNQDFDPQNTYGAIGFKFSLIRPPYEAKQRETLDYIHEKQKQLNRLVIDIAAVKRNAYLKKLEERNKIREDIRKNSTDEKDFAIKYAQQEEDTSSALHKVSQELANLNKEQIEEGLKSSPTANLLSKQLDENVASFDNTRIGWSWDIAGGTSIEFRDNQFNNSKLYNAGVWTTLGFNTKRSSFLGLARFLQNPDHIFAKDNQVNTIGDIMTFDAGLRYLYSTSKSKFTLSLEAIYRSVLSSNTIDPSWRFILNADYAIWQNQKLTFSFGRNFDGAITKDGNLVAALTFLTGFGNKR